MKNNKALKIFGYVFLILILLFVVFLFFFSDKKEMNEQNQPVPERHGILENIGNNVNSFFTAMENKTFDARQGFLSKYRHVSDDIVVITIDERSYSELTNEFGEWPVPRNIYADTANFISEEKPYAIDFDLMFGYSMKNNRENDLKLAKVFSQYDNIFAAMIFEKLDEEETETLPKNLTIKIDNKSKINYNSEILNMKNYRQVLSEIINTTSNIGHTTSYRDPDGIFRRYLPLIMYKNNYYPNMSLKVAIKYLEEKEHITINELKIDKNNNLLIANKKIPLQNDGLVFLNWYDTRQFKEISFIDVYNKARGVEKPNRGELEPGFFKDKIVYIGATATALYDIKSGPTDSRMPGVFTHTTFMNNLINSDFIKRSPFGINLIISLSLSLLLIIVLVRVNSTFVCSLAAILTVIAYICLTVFVMAKFALWIPVVVPVCFMIGTFTGTYLWKYLAKSKDLEYTYKLATTDGLTELYNHRFFQEQVVLNIETCRRYNSNFSLVLIDIDFFKKFNDSYGHQAGDNVLKQVAQLLKKSVRTTDIVCRYGGEEMAIILTNTDKKEALYTAQKICTQVSQAPFKIAPEVEKNVTISLGVSTYPQDGLSPSELIEHADKGLYCAKRNGRNQVGMPEGEEV